MLELRNAGYVGSRRGRSGGYVLIKPPGEISIKLLRQVDGPIAPLPCLSRRSIPLRGLRGRKDRRLRKMFGQVFWSHLLLIRSLTLDDLLDQGGLPDMPAIGPA